MVEEKTIDNIIDKSDLKSPQPFLGCQPCGKKFLSGIAQKKHMASFHPSTNNDTKNEKIDTLNTFFEASPIKSGVKIARTDSIENLNSKFKSTNNSMAATSPKPESVTGIDFSQLIEDINNSSDSKKVPMDIGLNVDITPDTSFTEVYISF